MITALESKMISAKQEFASKNPSYDLATIDNLRSKAYARLDAQQHVYLDYTGGSLYAKDQIEQHQEYLLDNILGNPHSTNPSSMHSTMAVEEARNRVLTFLMPKIMSACLHPMPQERSK